MNAMELGGKTATDWYTKAFDDAIMQASRIHPELANDPHQKMGFTAALAVTSQGEKVSSNVRLAEQVYDHFKQTGRFPTDVVAKKKKFMNENFGKLNKLLDNLGEEGTREFLNKDFTVKELVQAGYDVGGENMTTKVKGSAILGPKIGQGFFQNLNGNYNPVTMDLWFMRGWGRLTGTLVGTRDMAKPTARLQDAMRSEGIKVPRDPDKLEKLTDEIWRKHERDYINNRADYDSGKKTKSELTFAADRYLQNLRGIKEQPTSGGERNWIRDRIERTQQILKGYGHNMTNADLQAIWWYPEKKLYDKLGGPASEKINVDYATAFRDLADKRGGANDQAKTAQSGPLQAVGDNRPGRSEKSDDGRRNGRSRQGRKETDGTEERARGGPVRYRAALNTAYNMRRAAR